MKYLGVQINAADLATVQKPYASLDEALTQIIATQWLMLAALAALLDDQNLTPLSAQDTNTFFSE